MSNGCVFKIREVDAMHVLRRQAVLRGGITFLVLLKTTDKCQLVVAGEDTSQSVLTRSRHLPR